MNSIPKRGKRNGTNRKTKPSSDIDPEQSAEAKAPAEDAAREDADAKRLATDLDDLRQTLLRRQADFDNYRKRIEKERAEDQKRATARVVEGLIPVVDGFEHALAAHKEAEYESYRKGFEMIYKQLLDNLRNSAWTASSPLASPSIRIFTRPWIAPKPRKSLTARFWKFFSRAMFFMDESCGQPWFA